MKLAQCRTDCDNWTGIADKLDKFEPSIVYSTLIYVASVDAHIPECLRNLSNVYSLSWISSNT